MNIFLFSFLHIYLLLFQTMLRLGADVNATNAGIN